MTNAIWNWSNRSVKKVHNTVLRRDEDKKVSAKTPNKHQKGLIQLMKDPLMQMTSASLPENIAMFFLKSQLIWNRIMSPFKDAALLLERNQFHWKSKISSWRQRSVCFCWSWLNSRLKSPVSIEWQTPKLLQPRSRWVRTFAGERQVKERTESWLEKSECHLLRSPGSVSGSTRWRSSSWLHRLPFTTAARSV